MKQILKLIDKWAVRVTISVLNSYRLNNSKNMTIEEWRDNANAAKFLFNFYRKKL